MLVGIDSLEIKRFREKIKNKTFLDKYFTSYEIEYGFSTVNAVARFAGIFCGKEAFLKALGIGIGGGIKLKDIEIKHKPSGQPYFNLGESALQYLEQHDIKNCSLSITHTKSTSIAICVLN